MGRIGKNVNILGLLVVVLFTFILGAIGQPAKVAVAAGTGNASTLKSLLNGKFVSVSSDDAATIPTTADTTEMFDLELGSDGYYSIKSKLNGKYFSYSTDGDIQLNATSSLSTSEKFTKEENSGHVLFKTKKSYSNGNGNGQSNYYKYLTASNTTNSLSVSNVSNTNNSTWFTLGSTTTNIIKVLEVTESGQSDLSSLFGSLLSIDTYSMKEFVASRDYLDGKYDAIYIGKGTTLGSKKPYSTSLLSAQTQGSTEQSNNHNTTNIQNDITQLKADEITNNFIKKDYLLFSLAMVQAALINKKLMVFLKRISTSICHRTRTLLMLSSLVQQISRQQTIS